jgi:tRNA-dihydrouridine synthase B
MVSVKGLEYNNDKTKKLLTLSPLEKPSAAQIFGSDPEVFRKVISGSYLNRFDIIDINMGCPVQKVFNNGDGSALIKDKVLASEIVRAAVEGAEGRPITAKIRIGINKEEGSVDFAKALEIAGVSAVTVHGRTRAQMYSGKADLVSIKNIKEALKIPVIGNGDVIDKASYINMIEKTNVDGVMIGRGALGKPYIFSEILNENYEFDIKENIIYHLNSLLKVYNEKTSVNLIKKHICFYGAGRRNSKEIKTAVNNSISIKEIQDIVNLYFDDIKITSHS